MTLSAASRLQSNSGTGTGTTITATLPNPVSDGSTLLLFIGVNGGTLTLGGQSFDPPWFQDAGRGGADFVWRRDSQPAGETSWAFTQAANSPYI